MAPLTMVNNLFNKLTRRDINTQLKYLYLFNILYNNLFKFSPIIHKK